MKRKELNVLILNGATRVNGNTDTILKTIIKSSKNSEVKIKQIDLRKKNIANCIGCFQCENSDKCSIKDDMVELYDEINKSDLLIFASPIYFWGVTGIMKAFIDRLYYYYSPFNKKLIAGKKAIVISPMNMHSDIHKLDIVIKFYDFLFDNLDMELVDAYYFGNINERGDIDTNAEYLRQMDHLGKNLIKYFEKTDQNKDNTRT
jgi:multimeric flavodoxin WrbA